MSTPVPTLEERITALEREVAALKARPRPHEVTPDNWIDAIEGVMEDLPEYDQVIELIKTRRQEELAALRAARAQRPEANPEPG